ncbi:c-type heme family protein [Sulfurospirillum sp.]|uniref:c-type heme family protein n=1 Tax=Sulfurospirillum sp. TaxID=2053622 RepID=UPI002FDD46AF
MKYSFKIIVALFVVMYSIITLLFFNFYRELAMKDARQEAIFILDTMNAIRDYVSVVQRPLIDELKEKKMLAEDFFDPRLLSSSYITREIYNIQRAKKNINYDYKLIATNPLNPEHEGNSFENEILDDFKEGKYQEYSQIIKENNKPYFFVGLPIHNSHPSCLQCHTTNSAPKRMVEQYHTIPDFQSKVGDVIAMISFKIPVYSILTYHVKEFIVGGFVMFIVFVIFILFIYKIYKNELRLKEKTNMLMMSQNRLASMGEMIGNISHQWRQPLAQVGAILINLELHSDQDKLTKEKVTKKIAEANAQLAFMSNTIDDFKNFFLPNKAKKEFSAQEVIFQAKKLLSASLEKYAIDVSIDIQNNFIRSGYANEIVQVLINIMNNAKEAFMTHHSKDKQIKITAFLQNGVPIMTLENNAGHIDPAIIEKVFDPYFTTKESSSGLGLYMSQMIIEKSGATLRVENSDEGVIFTIIF